MWVWLSAGALATTVDEVPNPRPRGSWVADVADVLPPEVESRIDARVDALHRDLDAEIAVVTIPSAGATSEKEFATSLFNTWGIGDAQADNGLLVLLVLDTRRIEMETGYGLEPLLPDGWLGRLQTEQMVPRFREGDYAGGIEAGIGAVDTRLRETPEETRTGADGTTPGTPGGSGRPRSSWSAWWWPRWSGWGCSRSASSRCGGGSGPVRTAGSTCRCCRSPRTTST
jgi:uncharacterized protein